MTLMVLPWMTDLQSQVLSLWHEKQLPHAICLQGGAGLGKQHQLMCLAAAFFCQQLSAGVACGACQHCQLLSLNEHPDFMQIQPQVKGKKIGIDQIREITEFAVGTAYFAQARLILIQPLEQMTRAASNALLKLLEEPPPQVYFLLATTRASRLMPTIRSRVQFYTVIPPSTALFFQWAQALSTDLTQDIARQAYTLSYAGPFLALGFIWRHFNCDQTLKQAPFFKPLELKSIDLLAEFNRFEDYMSQPSAQTAVHLKLLTKAISIPQSLLFFDLWFAGQITSVSTAPEARRVQFWQSYCQLQDLNDALIRSPQLNDAYLQRTIVRIIMPLISESLAS